MDIGSLFILWIENVENIVDIVGREMDLR